MDETRRIEKVDGHINNKYSEEILKTIGNAQKIASTEAILVATYEDLLEQIAYISYENPHNTMYFRGQNQDYLNSSGNTTIYPSIYRGTLSSRELENRFELLHESAKVLVQYAKDYEYKGITELKRKKQIQWSILQHYEICDTPYLDITHSLRVASSFATMDSNSKYGYLYVLAFPYLSNRITVNSEEDLLLIRLLSISPPDAKRPYYQEGFIAATTDITHDYDNKNELDFKSRLVAKYKFPNDSSFWGKDFAPLRKKFLYPDDDKFCDIARKVKIANKRGFNKDRVGDFLLLWNELDEILREYAKYNKHVSLANVLRKSENLHYYSERFYKEVKYLNDYRNILVHKTKEVKSNELEIQITNLKGIVDEFKSINSIVL